MRITNNIIQRDALGSMQTNLRAISQAQRQVSSGLRIQDASDDPSGTSAAMQARGSLRALDQYRRNISSATSRATAEESVLDQLSNVLIRAKELGLSQAGGNASATTRQVTRAEVDELIEFAVQLGNTRFGDEYLFGGQYANQKPFDSSVSGFVPLDGGGTPMTPEGARPTEIYTGQYLTASHDGKQVFLDSGALQALRDLSDALGDPDPETAVRNALSGLDAAFTDVQTLVGEVGARVNQLEVTGANLDSLSVNLQTLKSEIEDVDLETAVTELVSRQTAYQAAMLATSRVIGLTLADYLR